MFAYCRKDGLPVQQAILAEKLERLRDDDVAGPRLPEEISLDSLRICHPIPANLQSKEPIESCLNWTPEEIKTALLAATGGAPSGLTQVTYIPQDQQGEFDYNNWETKTNDEEDDDDDDNEDDNDNEDRVAKERDVYPVLAPIMKDLYALAPQNCTVGQLRMVTSSVETLLMVIKTASYKEDQSKKQPNTSGGSGNDGGCEGSSRIKLISTNPQLEKSNKTHGTKRKR
jgi:hypothetical protein